MTADRNTKPLVTGLPWRRVAVGFVGMAGAVTWLEFALRVVLPALAEERWPTSAYWVAPRLALEGRVQLLYDREGFTQAALGLGANGDVFNANSPGMLLLVLPWGLLPQAAALDAWLLLGLAALGAAWAALLRSVGVPLWLGALLTATLPLQQPLRHNVVWGQAYTFVLLGLVAVGAGSLAHRRAGTLAGGVSAVLLAAFKAPYGIAALGVGVLGGRRSYLAGAAAAAAAVVVLTIAAWGTDPWLAWLRDVVASRERPETAVLAYQTVNGLLGQLFRADPMWNPRAVADLPGLVGPLWVLAVVGLAAPTIALLVRLARREGLAGSDAVDAQARRWLAVALVTPPAVLLAPVAEDHHYVVALIPLTVAAAALQARTRPRRLALAGWATLAAAFLLIAAPWPFNTPDAPGWEALLHYPRVYGMLLVWALVAVLAARRRLSEPQGEPG